MKRKEASVVEPLRMLRAALKNAEIEKRDALTDEEVVKVIQTMAKQLREAQEQFRSGGREDLATKNEAELAVLQVYLPAQMSDEEIRPIVERAIAETGAVGAKDFGKVMGKVSGELRGRADMGKVGAMIKEKLGQE